MSKIKEEAAKAKRVVIVGAGFVGTEAAGSLISQYKEMDLHLICSSDVPF